MIHGTKLLSLAAAIAVVISAPALAGDKSKLDTNRDGKIDIAEAQAANMAAQAAISIVRSKSQRMGHLVWKVVACRLEV